ncbi:MAG: acyl carrier protein [Planctomycetia bacterium]|jgi:acyl carrier protein
MNAAPDDLVARLIELAADVFGVPAAELSDNSSSETIEAWDSISHLNLMLAVEQAFGVRIEPEQMVELTSIARIANAVLKLRAG